MTIGAFALVLLETAPILPPVPELAAQTHSRAATIVKQTEVPVEQGAWRNIVLHVASEGRALADKCHFVVDGTNILATEHWRMQQPAKHVFSAIRGHDYNADSIGVFISRDFSVRPPTDEEANALIELVTSLQDLCRIDRGKVYFHKDLNPLVEMPSRALASLVSSRLLPIK